LELNAAAGRGDSCRESRPVGDFSIGDLAHLRGARHDERVVDQRFNAFDEANRMRQVNVTIERRFILPARMNVEQSRLTIRPQSVNAEAARLLACRYERVEQYLRQGVLVAGTGVKSGKYEQLRALLVEAVGHER